MAEDAMMNIRNARFNQFGGIDCEVEARGEWVPFTASEDDSEAFGRQVYAAAAADSGTAAYVAPDPEPEPDPEEALAQARAAMVISPLQGILTLGEKEWGKVLTYRETATWQERMVIDNAADWVRTSQNIEFFGYLLDYTPEEMDALFIAAAKVTA